MDCMRSSSVALAPAASRQLFFHLSQFESSSVLAPCDRLVRNLVHGSTFSCVALLCGKVVKSLVEAQTHKHACLERFTGDPRRHHFLS